MRSPESAVATEPCLTLGCFEVGGRTFGMDVTSIREIVCWRPVMPLPGSPRLIEGVIDFRGTMIPVVDLGRVLGQGPTGETRRARIIITQIGELVVGLIVQEATAVLTVEASDLSRPSDLTSPTCSEITRAIVRQPGGDPIVVLSLEPLLGRVRDSGPPGSEASA